MSIDQVNVRELTEYTPEAAKELGRLTSYLTSRSTGQPISEEKLRGIVESKQHVQLVAVLDGRIVGAATLTHVRGIVDDRAYLTDFVTDEEVRGRGIGHKLWQKMEEWCRARGLEEMDFTSRSTKVEAHNFYLNHGAKKRSTIPFRVNFKKG